MERREQWSIERGTHYWNVLNENGSEIVSEVHEHVAKKILNDHNQHAALVEQRFSLIEALKGVAIMLNTNLLSYDDEPWAQRVRNALATVEQGEEA